METEGQIGYKTYLRLGVGSPLTYPSTIAEVKEIGGFGFSAGMQEATHMESPDGYKEYVASMKDGDTMTVRCNFTPGNDVELKALADAGLRAALQLEFPGDLPTYTFTAVPVAWHVQGVTPDGLLEVTLGLKISGTIV